LIILAFHIHSVVSSNVDGNDETNRIAFQLNHETLTKWMSQEIISNILMLFNKAFRSLTFIDDNYFDDWINFSFLHIRFSILLIQRSKSLILSLKHIFLLTKHFNNWYFEENLNNEEFVK
jgi:hypothetical protein